MSRTRNKEDSVVAGWWSIFSIRSREIPIITVRHFVLQSTKLLSYTWYEDAYYIWVHAYVHFDLWELRWTWLMPYPIFSLSLFLFISPFNVSIFIYICICKLWVSSSTADEMPTFGDSNYDRTNSESSLKVILQTHITV